MHRWSTLSLASAAVVLALASAASAQQVRRAEPLRGGNENPPIVTDGTGNFRARLFPDRIEDRLRYDVLSEEGEEVSDVTQAHLHVANPGNNGGIVAFLCSNVGTPGGVTAPECPDSPGEVEGEITAEDVLVDNPDGVLTAGDLEGLERLIRQGAIYVNIHTNDHGGGEVRGQMTPRTR
jgi:hypothetical protein